MNLRYILTGVVICGAIASALAFKPFEDKEEMPKATVSYKLQNLYIFHYCEPAQPFEELGNIEVLSLGVETPKDLAEKLVRKAKSRYGNAQAIIATDDMQSCRVIQFKE